MPLKPSDWIMIAAIVLGPILAVATQLVAQGKKEKRAQRLWVFSTLMSLRATQLAPDYVRALNYIDVVFYKNNQVRSRWNALLGHLNSPAYNDENFGPATVERTRDLLSELLAEIAKDLGYKYDHTQIKNNAYYPRGLGNMEQQLAEIRTLTVALLRRDSSLRVTVGDVP